MADWHPRLQGNGPIHKRLAEALRRDVESGALPRETRLPPQRALADRLGISVGTVTKALQEAERLGLVSGQVGRGTFVKGAAPDKTAAGSVSVDLSINVVPLDRAGLALAASLRRLARSPMSHDLLAYAPPAGPEAHRKAAAIWLARTASFPDIDWSKLLLTGGGQQAIALAFAVCCPAGSTLLCEAATYYGMKALAEHAGLKLHAVAMDDQGVVPEALDRAAAATGARVAYLMPTAQVPTGRTMSAGRRRDIIMVARARQLRIIEDDHYAVFNQGAGRGEMPLAQLAPNICFYLSGVSKSLSPGLRTGFLVAPTQGDIEQLLKILRCTAYANSSFGSTLMAEWIENGSAFDIAADMVTEVTARWRLASGILQGHGVPELSPCPHVWVPLTELDAERVAGRAQRAGVTVTPPELPVVNARLISGLRLCIGAPGTREALALGLNRFCGALAGTSETASAATI